VTRTHGTYAYIADGAHRGRWDLTLEPAVAMRAKRVFGRVQQGRTGVISIAHTDEVARDLEWFLQRFPLDPADDTTAAKLTSAAQEHIAREARITAALTHTDTLTFDDALVLKTPRPYQVQALDLLRARGRYILGDDVGLGKTLSALLGIADGVARPALVVPPAHLPQRWIDELNESMPHLSIEVAAATKPSVRALTGDFADVTIVPYSKLAGWRDVLAGQMRTVVFEEVHNLRRGVDTEKGKAAAHVSEAADFVLGLTATPVYNYGGEVWEIYNIVAPGELGTKTEFTREWGHNGNNGHIHVSSPAALGSYLRESGLLLRRTREDVSDQISAIPEPIRVPQMVESDPKVLESIAGDAAALARLILSETSTRQQRFQASGDLDWRMREATGIAKAPYVAEFVRMLLQSEDRVALFGWHRAVWDIWKESLAEFSPVLFTGSETPKQKNASLDAFKSGDARVLMMSLRSGEGVDGLQQACSVAVFGELDWSPAVHTQAIGRFARDGQDLEKPVVAYFLHAADGSDPALMEALQVKRNQADPILSHDGGLVATKQDLNRGRLLAQQVLAATGTHHPTKAAPEIWAPPAIDQPETPTLWEETA